jgi:hypothetical protein
LFWVAKKEDWIRKECTRETKLNTTKRKQQKKQQQTPLHLEQTALYMVSILLIKKTTTFMPTDKPH